MAGQFHFVPSSDHESEANQFVLCGRSTPEYFCIKTRRSNANVGFKRVPATRLLRFYYYIRRQLDRSPLTISNGAFQLVRCTAAQCSDLVIYSYFNFA